MAITLPTIPQFNVATIYGNQSIVIIGYLVDDEIREKQFKSMLVVGKSFYSYYDLIVLNNESCLLQIMNSNEISYFTKVSP